MLEFSSLLKNKIGSELKYFLINSLVMEGMIIFGLHMDFIQVYSSLEVSSKTKFHYLLIGLLPLKIFYCI